MAGEDSVLRMINGSTTVVSIEDNTHTDSIDDGTVSVGDVVYQVSGTDSKVARADADNASARPPIGVCLSLPTSTTAAVVHSGGTVSGLTGLTRGAAYWLSTTPGAVTSTRPATNAYIVGVAISETSLVVCCVPADLVAGSGGTITVKEAGITVNTDFTTLNFTGSAEVTDAGGGEATINITGGGGGGTTSTMWNPKVAPASPNVKDDEFDDEAVDAKWTEFDPTNVLTVTEDAYGLKLAIVDDVSGDNVAGVRQAIPTSDEFELVARITVEGAVANYIMGGIYLAGDIATDPTTAPLFVLHLRLSSAGHDLIEAINMANRTTWSGTAYSVSIKTDTVYLALQWKASTGRACLWFSHTGVGWTRLSDASYDPTSLAAASYMGIFANGYNADGTVRAEFFRVREAASGILNNPPEKLGGRVYVSPA